MIEFFRVLVILVAIGIAWTTTFWYFKADTFKTYTGWENPTNEHSRDAAMLVFNY